jgi:hypothetical protein
MTFVPYALLALSILACAASVYAWWRSSTLASRLRSMSSMQGELLEIRDYLGKVDAWAKRINAREVMNERRGIAPEHSGQVASKDELRRRAGIIAGRPAPHREN